MPPPTTVPAETSTRGGDGWSLSEGAAPPPRAVLAIAAHEVPGLLTKGPTTAADTTTYDGDVALAQALAIGLLP